MNKRLFKILLTGLLAAVSLVSCKEDEGIDPNSAEPVVVYPYDALVADLNMADNLPVVAVVKAQAGLQSVSLTILTDKGEVVPVQEVVDFFNPQSYSLSARVNYKSGYTEAVVSAVDKLGRTVEKKLPIRIVDVVEVPEIVFTPESFTYDEMIGGEMSKTHFETTTSATLRKVEMFRVKATGQEDFSTVDFTDEDPKQSYIFEELIAYNEFDKGFKVKVTDSYGQVRIATMSVKYKTVPPPTVTFADVLISADKDESKPVNIAIESQAGVVKVELFRLDGTTETKVKTTTYDKLKTLSYSEPMVFTNSTSGVKVVVTDNVGRSTTMTTKASVNLLYTPSISIGTAPVPDGSTDADGANRLLSFIDMKSYSVQECFDDPALQSRVDVKVYYMNANASDVRIYSIKNDKANEYKTPTGKSLVDFATSNATLFKILPADFDFDNATAADIATIDAASILSTNVQTKGIPPVIAFKTAATSAAGGGKVGIMKLISVSEKVGANANARVFTFAVKFPKQQ